MTVPFFAPNYDKKLNLYRNSHVNECWKIINDLIIDDKVRKMNQNRPMKTIENTYIVQTKMTENVDKKPISKHLQSEIVKSEHIKTVINKCCKINIIS